MKLINFFRRFFTAEIKRLHVDSANIVDVFTRTVNGLTVVNNEIEKSVENRVKRISKLEEEKSVLVTLRESNEKVINKLNAILKD